MLKPVPPSLSGLSEARVAIVASEFNRRHVDGLLDGAVRVLREAGAEVGVFRVPGAFEIPVVAEILASERPRRWSAVLCLGVIIRGETAHADLIATAITGALMEIGVRRQVPVIHEVLLVANRAQADVRCIDPRFNRGAEAGQTALAMTRLVARLRGEAGPPRPDRNRRRDGGAPAPGPLRPARAPEAKSGHRRGNRRRSV